MGLIYFVIFTAILIVVIQNFEIMNYRTSLKFFHLQTPEFPMGLLIILIFAVGYVIGYIRAAPAAMRAFLKSREIEKLKKRMEELEKSKPQPQPQSEATEYQGEKSVQEKEQET